MQDEFGDDQDLYNKVASATDIEDLPGPDDEGVDASEYPEGTEPVIEAILDDVPRAVDEPTRPTHGRRRRHRHHRGDRPPPASTATVTLHHHCSG